MKQKISVVCAPDRLRRRRSLIQRWDGRTWTIAFCEYVPRKILPQVNRQNSWKNSPKKWDHDWWQSKVESKEQGFWGLPARCGSLGILSRREDVRKSSQAAVAAFSTRWSSTTHWIAGLNSAAWCSRVTIYQQPPTTWTVQRICIECAVPHETFYLSRARF